MFRPFPKRTPLRPRVVGKIELDGLTVTSKAQNDFVSEVDRRAEQDIIYVIRKAFPDHAILAEER